MPKILITGFEPFREVTTNPSQLIVEHLTKQNNPDLITEVLPVVYRKAEERIKALLHEHQPDAVIMLGVAQKREEINLERIAVNLDDATIPDNNGRPMTGTRIFVDAPVGYWSTLPLESMHAAITQAEIPVKFSNHAGTFLCNHVFYIARHTLEVYGRASIPCGFIHLPSIETMPIETQIRGIELCSEVLSSELTHQVLHKHYSDILKQAMERLSPKPRQAAIITVDGKILADCTLSDETQSRTAQFVDADRLAAMSAATYSLSQRISSELRNGEFRETIIYGTVGIFILTYLSEKFVFATIFNTVPSLNSIRKQLHDLKNGLNKLVAAMN